MIPKARNKEAATHNRHPQAELPAFPVPSLPRLRRQRAAQCELTPELIRIAQGWWDWVLGHLEFPQSARGAAVVVVVAGGQVWVRADRPTAERGRREASPGRTLPFSGARLPGLPRQRTAQGELTPELTRTAQGWWDWVLGHREFPQSARGAAAVVVAVGGSAVGSAGRWVVWARADCPTAERGRQA